MDDDDFPGIGGLCDDCGEAWAQCELSNPERGAHRLCRKCAFGIKTVFCGKCGRDCEICPDEEDEELECCSLYLCGGKDGYDEYYDGCKRTYHRVRTRTSCGHETCNFWKGCRDCACEREEKQGEDGTYRQAVKNEAHFKVRDNHLVMDQLKSIESKKICRVLQSIFEDPRTSATTEGNAISASIHDKNILKKLLTKIRSNVVREELEDILDDLKE